jgi:MoaA/NifB/PqqE/SkfB family radical SAM enzyme
MADFIMPKVERLNKVHFEAVGGCNLRCVGCPISTLLPKVRRIPVEDFRLCMEHLDVQSVGFLRLFNFGETLLHPNLSGLFEVVKTLPYPVHAVEISTNGQFAHWDDLEKAFRVGVLKQLAVSCDGDGTPASYERLRPPGKWEKLIEFLRKARELRDRHAPDMQLLTRTICTDPHEQARWRSVLEPLGWTPEFRDWIALPDASVNMTGHALHMPRQVCRFLRQVDRLYVDVDGTVIPCCAHPKAGDFGNLKYQTFSEILHGMPRDRMVRYMHTDRAGMDVCNRCEEA